MPEKWQQPLKTTAAIAAVAAAYFCAGKFGLSLAFVHASASAVWPPTGIALAALLLWGYRLWPGIFLGAFLVNITTQGSLATTLGVAAGNTLESLMGAWLVCRFAGGLKAFGQAKNIFRFVLAAMLSTVISASLGVTSLSLGGLARWEDYPAIWFTWWLGDMVGDLIVAPLLVIWLTQPLLRLKRKQIVEGLGLLVTLVFVGQIVFLGKTPFDDKNAPLGYLALLPLLWGAVRFSHFGAITSAFLASGIALWGTLHGFGPFVRPGPNESLLFLQAFMGTVTMTALVLAAVISERKRVEQRLQVQDAVSRVLAEASTLAEATPKIIQVLCEMAGWDIGAIWSVNRSANELSCVAVWHVPSLDVQEFEAITRQSRFAPGTGLPGRVWRSGKAVWVSDVTKDSNFPRAPVALNEGLHAGFCFPIRLGDEILGVIECFTRQVREPDDDFLHLLADIGARLGQFIERKRAEEALRENESRLHLALESGRMGTWEWTIATNQVTWSPALEAIHALRPGTFGGRFEDFKRDIHPEDVKSVLAQIEKTLEQRSDYHAAYRIVRPTGDVRWLEAFGRIVFGPDRLPEKLLGVCMDVTERQRTEQSLRAKEAQVRLITDTAPVMLAQYGNDERYRFVNRAYAERFGLTPDQIVGKSMVEILGEHAYDASRPYIERVRKGESVEYEIDVLYERTGGRFVRVAYEPEKDMQGNVIGWVAAITDMTERKRTEEARQQSEALKGAILDSALDCIITIDHDGKIIEFNPAAEKTFGYPRSQALGKPLADLIIPPRLRERHHRGFAAYLTSGEGSVLGQRVEMPALRADGTEFPAELSINAIQLGGDRIFTAYLRDITERKRAEVSLQHAKDELAKANEELEKRVQERTIELESANAALLREIDEGKKLEAQLRQAQKMESIGTLAGGIAHDFNNILNIIKGYASVLRRRDSEDSELVESLEIIDKTTERGASIVQQLLAIARRNESNFEPVKLNESLEQLKSLLGGIFPKTIDIVLHLDTALPMVKADVNQIEQVLLNICLNARDAMSEGGKLLLTSGIISGAALRDRFQQVKEEQYACISVSDTGEGMSEAVKSRIFEPFFTTKEQSQGTGLGLSVAYGIVANHDGFIEVVSRPNHGTTFLIYLPLLKAGAAARDRTQSASAKKFQTSSGQGHTILFVEDEAQQLNLMRRLLESEGYRVLVAADGLEALETFLAQKDEISLVVLDLGLPKLNGWQAFQKMKQTDPELQPVLATGYISPEIEAALANGELSGIIMKPYRLDEVLEKVASAVVKTRKNLTAMSPSSEDNFLGVSDAPKKRTTGIR